MEGGKKEKPGQEISSERERRASAAAAAVISPSYVTGQRFHWEPQRSADVDWGLVLGEVMPQRGVQVRGGDEPPPEFTFARASRS